MRKLIYRYAVLALCIAASGTALMQISQKVQRAEDRQAALERSIEREQNRIEVLHAEWSYLNSPGRLEILATEILELAPPQTDQMIGDVEDLPDMVSQEDLHPDSQVFATPQPVYYKARKPRRELR